MTPSTGTLLGARPQRRDYGLEYREKASIGPPAFEHEGGRVDASHRPQIGLHDSYRTAPMRLAAVQADSLLRRRHPEMPLEPVRSAEPEPLPDQLPARTDEARQQHAALAAESLAVFRAEIDNRAGVLVPHEDPDLEPEGEAWPDLRRPHRDAILQPRPVMPAPRRRPEPEPELQA